MYKMICQMCVYFVSSYFMFIRCKCSQVEMWEREETEKDEGEGIKENTTQRTREA